VCNRAARRGRWWWYQNLKSEPPGLSFGERIRGAHFRMEGTYWGWGKVGVQVLGLRDPAACEGGKGWGKPRSGGLVFVNDVHGASDLDSGRSIGAG